MQRPDLKYAAVRDDSGSHPLGTAKQAAAAEQAGRTVAKRVSQLQRAAEDKNSRKRRAGSPAAVVRDGPDGGWSETLAAKRDRAIHPARHIRLSTRACSCSRPAQLRLPAARMRRILKMGLRREAGAAFSINLFLLW